MAGYDDFDYGSKKHSTSANSINGLYGFKKALERLFFADANIHATPNREKIDLVVTLRSNFSLTESLFHLNNGNWGNCNDSQEATSSLASELLRLANENTFPVDIKEITICLRDTSIIITRIFDYSIPDEFCKLLGTISANYVYLTKGLSELPYEIYVPIFEDGGHYGNDHKFSPDKAENDYMRFWELYFPSKQDSYVYDVENKVILEAKDASLYLLND